MIRNAMNSATKVQLGSRKLPEASTCLLMPEQSLLVGEDEYEEHREGEVDEVHRLDETDGEEEQGLETALGLRLPGDALDQRATGQAVTDGRADGATAEREATADETAGELDCLLRAVSHDSSIP